MIDLSRIKKFNESKKVVLIRFDLNVPLDSDELHKSERVIRIKKTIKKLYLLIRKLLFYLILADQRVRLLIFYLLNN